MLKPPTAEAIFSSTYPADHFKTKDFYSLNCCPTNRAGFRHQQFVPSGEGRLLTALTIRSSLEKLSEEPSSNGSGGCLQPPPICRLIIKDIYLLFSAMRGDSKPDLGRGEQETADRLEGSIGNAEVLLLEDALSSGLEPERGTKERDILPEVKRIRGKADSTRLTMKPKILIVDDEVGVIEMIESHFSLRGFEVFSAGDGARGIEVCGRVRPDVILLDLKMKSMDGDKALPELRRIAPTAKIFVISAYQEDIVRRRIAGLGADAYFEKPASIVELEKAVRESLRGDQN